MILSLCNKPLKLSKPVIRWKTILFFIFAIFTYPAIAENAHVDPKTRIIYPQTIGEFTFNKVNHYDDERLGYGLNYWSENDILITVIVYDLGMKHIKTGIGGKLVKAQYELSQDEVNKGISRGHYESVVPLRVPKEFSEKFLKASYHIVYTGGDDKRSHLFIRGHKKHFIKIRATGLNTKTIDPEITRFLNEFLMIIK